MTFTYLKIKTDEHINKSERECSLNYFSTNPFVDFFIEQNVS